MCDHVWIFEARTLSTQPVRRRCGINMRDSCLKAGRDGAVRQFFARLPAMAARPQPGSGFSASGASGGAFSASRVIRAAFFIPLGGSPRGFRADVLRSYPLLSSTLGISERATNSARTLATVLSLSPTASPICTSVCCGSALSVSLSGVKFSGFRTVRHRRGIASLGIAAKQRNALFRASRCGLRL
jgi:hypothetical protein